MAWYLAGKLHLFDEKGHAVSVYLKVSKGHSLLMSRRSAQSKAWLSLTPLSGAALVAISRTMDYRRESILSLHPSIQAAKKLNHLSLQIIGKTSSSVLSSASSSHSSHTANTIPISPPHARITPSRLASLAKTATITSTRPRKADTHDPHLVPWIRSCQLLGRGQAASAPEAGPVLMEVEWLKEMALGRGMKQHY